MEYGFKKGRKFIQIQFLLDLFDETLDSSCSGTFQDMWKCNYFYERTCAKGYA